jgi:methylmalonyl-CoA mutase cobalamin-binding domain/chain
MTTTEINDYKKKLIELIIEAKRTEAVSLIDKLAEDAGYFAAINLILEPVLIEIGEMWSKENLSLAQGYVSAKITEDILLNAVDSSEWQLKQTENNVPVVLANIEDDFHALGRKMIGTFLKAFGWQVHDLGNDVLAEEIIDAAVKCNAPIVGVSAMMYTSALNIKKVRDEINRRNLQDKIKLAVGGAIFKVRPQLVNEVGGDGTASSATEVPELFSHLLKTINQ